jgi:hypothetical protein
VSSAKDSIDSANFEWYDDTRVHAVKHAATAGITIGSMLLPGPEDAVMAAIFSKYGIRASVRGGKTVLERVVGNETRQLTEKEAKVLLQEYKAAKSGQRSFWAYLSEARGVGRFEFTQGYSTRSLGGEAKDVIVYWVVDSKTRQVLKVGDTTAGGAVGRWGNYVGLAKAEKRTIEIECVRFNPSAPRRTPSVEDALRTEFESQGHQLPWDQERGRNPCDFQERP